jgi:hypothetical protein
LAVERIEELLREEFQRSDRVLVSPREAMLARVTAVRRRRQAVGAGLAAVALAVGGSVAAVAAVGGPGGDGDGAGVGIGGDPPQPQYSVQLVNVVFTDHNHGYVVQERCSEDALPAPGATDSGPGPSDGASGASDGPSGEPSPGPTPDVHRRCAMHLVTTADAGRTWQERTLPGEVATKDAGVPLVPGHSLALWMDSPGTLAVGGWTGRYWTTTDGGLTWHEAAAAWPAGPAGSLAVFGPRDGMAFLDAPPPGVTADMISAKNPIVAASDGSFWSACRSQACVRVTRDGGRNWSTVPIGGAATAVDWVATADGATVYAAVRTPSGQRLMRSTGGGAFADLGVDVPATGAGLALPNGDLIMSVASEVGGLLRLRAGPGPLEAHTRAPAHAGLLYMTCTWVVAATVWDQRPDDQLGSVVSLSPDGGTTWLAIPPPPA